MEKHVKYLTENRKGRDHLEDQGTDDRVMLEWALTKEGVRILIRVNWSLIQFSGRFW
jgi:hypothetical protein